MKNKKVTYLLIVVALSIWAYIIYSFIEFKNVELKAKNSGFATINNNETNKNKLDSFVLLLNYDNPFLTENYTQVKKENIVISKSQSMNKSKINTSLSPANSLWPQVVFNGTISSNKENKLLCLINIQGTDYIVPVGGKAGEIDIINLKKDLITVSFNGEEKTISRIK